MARGRPTEIEQEAAAPDSDRLDDFLHPRETLVFFGHRPAERTLLEAARGGRLHHAWILSGREGIGKATLAYRMTRYLLVEAKERGSESLDVPADLPAVRQIAALSHPNLLVLRRPWQERNERFATSITIDEVRRLRSFLGTTPGSGQWRVVIVDRAEDMNVNAANALLKSLEEPPRNTLFLLVCSAPGELPATVRSRCRTLFLQPLDEQDLIVATRAALDGTGAEIPPPETMAQAVSLAGGSVRHALQLISGGGIDTYRSLMSLMQNLPRLDYARVHALGDKMIGRDGELRLELLFGLLEELLARLVRHAATGAGGNTEEAALAERLMPAGGLAPWAELWEEVRRAKADALALNLDRKSLVLGTFFRIEETARQSARRFG